MRARARVCVCVCVWVFLTSCSADISLSLGRGVGPLSEILNVAQKSKIVSLIVARRGGELRYARLMRRVHSRQMMMMQRMVARVRMNYVVGMGNLKVPWWRGSGQKWTRMPARKNGRGRYRCSLHTRHVVLLLLILLSTA